MPDYKNSKIYAIRSHQTENIYIGATTQHLAMRLGGHVSEYKKYIIGRHYYITSFDILKYEDYYIELVEEFSCENKEQLNKKEGEHIRANPHCVNKKIAGRKMPEYILDNKDKYLMHNRKYAFKNNKHQIKIKKGIKTFEEYVLYLDNRQKGIIDYPLKNVIPPAPPNKQLQKQKQKNEILESIYKSNPNITNAQMRKQSHIGSRLVNDFLKSKRSL